MRKYLLVLGIFLIALAARAYLAKYTYIFGFDSYYFARMGEYVVKYGSIPEIDPLQYRGFPEGQKPFLHTLAMYVPGWIYVIFFGNAYDMQNMLLVLKYLPAVLGSLGSLGVGLILLVLYGPIAAVLGAFFAATNPAYIYRTMSGFYEDDALGYAMITFAMAFAFAATAQKDKRRAVAYLAGAAIIGFLATMSWKAFLILPFSFVLFTAFLVGSYVIAFVRERTGIHKYGDYALYGISAALSLVVVFFLKHLAYIAAGRAYDVVGTVTETAVFTLAAPYASAVLYAVFAAATVAYLHTKKRKYLYASALAFVAGFVPFFLVSSNGFTARVLSPSGVEFSVGFDGGKYSPGAVFFGSALVTLAAMLVGSFSSYFVLREKSAEARRAVLFLFVPLLFSALAIPFSGNNWLAPLIYPILTEGKQVGYLHGYGTKSGWETMFDPKLAGVITITVGEETYGFLNWPAKYGFLAFFLFLSVPVLVYLGYRDRRYLFLLGWLVLAWYLAWLKLKFTYYLGIPVAFASALVLAEIYNRVDRKYRKAFLLAVLLLSFSMISTAVYHTVTRVPALLTDEEAKQMAIFGGQSGQDYIQAFEWIRENTPADANILNWWDIGNWITFFTGRGVTTDNTNRYVKADSVIARFFLSDEANAYAIARELNADYVFVTGDMVFRAQSLTFYAFNMLNMRDPRLAEYTPFSVRCSPVSSKTLGNAVVCMSGGAVWKVFDVNTWARIPPFAPGYWTPGGSNVVDLAGRRYVLYRTSSGLILLPEKLNESVATKFVLEAPMEHFKKVWESEKGKVLIYEVV